MRIVNRISKYWPRSWGYLPHKLWDLHLLRRLSNSINRVSMRLKGYRLIGGGRGNNRNGVFDIFLDSARKSVVKLPRRDDYYSYCFWASLRKPQNFEKYKHLLRQMSEVEHLGPHIVPVHQVFRSGGYISPFVDGYVLADLPDLSTGAHDIPVHEIEIAIIELGSALKAYVAAGGCLCGDWELHNLLYDRDSRRVMNVDAEGFYTFAPGRRENQLSWILSNLENVQKKM